MAIDPICGHEVDPSTAKWTSTYGGRKFYFCEPDCKGTFDRSPAKYAKRAHSTARK